MADLEAVALAASLNWLKDYEPTLEAASMPGVHPAACAINRCAQCGFLSQNIKFCPFCGPEMDHLPPARRCTACTEQVVYADAKFCGMCGAALQS